jgi:hypothetical protein
MPLVPFPTFVGPTYISQSPIADQEECVNFYVERLESPGATTPTVLYPTPGVTALGTVTTRGGRGAYAITGRPFVVFGNGLYELDLGSGTFFDTFLGMVAVDEHPATLTSNGVEGHQLFVTSGTVGSLFDLTSGVFTASVVTGVSMGGMIDGFFLALDHETGTLKISDSAQDTGGLTWDVTQIANRSAAPDPWISMVVNDRQIVLWGDQTGEIWYDAGSTPFPFALVAGSNFSMGTAAMFSGAVCDGTVYWLGQSAEGSRGVYRLQGYNAIKISTKAIDTALTAYARVDDAEGWSYEEDGHNFYVLNFPAANASWVYDATENLWHKRGRWNNALNRFDVLAMQSHCYAFNRHIVVDRESGQYGEMAATIGTEIDGGMIRRVRRSPALVNKLSRVGIGLFELFLESGLGVQSGQGSEPLVMLRVSHDGGRNWSSERTRSAGRAGHYDHPVRWLKCGAGRTTVFEVSVTDAIPWRLLTAYLGVTSGEAA